MPWVEQFHTWVRPLINQPASWAQVVQAVVSIIGFFCPISPSIAFEKQY
jgi:hypothetical protein